MNDRFEEPRLPVSDGHLEAALHAQFGVPTLRSPVARKKSRARKHNCGRFGRLTVDQIAVVSGLTVNGVNTRVQSGFKGEELCLPHHETLRRVRTVSQRPVMSVAMKLAKKFPNRIPSAKEIMDTHPMTLRTAQRWRQTMEETA